MSMFTVARLAVSVALALAAWPVVSATLYQWTEPSGETRFGYRPPPGVVGSVVGEKDRAAGKAAGPVNCRDLQTQHLALVDREIERVKNLKAGFGTQYEFTPEAKQRFINDLLALRSALVTGRPSEEFAVPDNRRQMKNMKEKFQQDQSKLLDELQTQAQQLQQQQQELQRQRWQNEFYLQRYWLLRPGFLY